jgi:hypothetical protein
LPKELESGIARASRRLGARDRILLAKEHYLTTFKIRDYIMMKFKNTAAAAHLRL